MRHLLKVSPETVHWGYYDSNLKPVLRVKSGDTIDVYTAQLGTPEIIRELGSRVPKELIEIYEKFKEKGPGPHVLTGPIYVEGAGPNDTLEISLIKIEPWVGYGFNLVFPDEGVIPEDYPYLIAKCVPIDSKKRLAIFSDIKIPIRPFFGVIGVVPTEGRISSMVLGPHGGNIDNKELVASSKVYLPIHIDGAMFSIGDGHACQGDGEVDSTALETCLRGLIQLNVKKGFKIKWPMAETKENFIFMGFAPDLDQALKIALRNAIEFLVGKGFDKDEAYVFCSLCVDFRITQAVGDLNGVHAMIPKDILKDKVGSLI